MFDNVTALEGLTSGSPAAMYVKSVSKVAPPVVSTENVPTPPPPSAAFSAGTRTFGFGFGFGFSFGKGFGLGFGFGFGFGFRFQVWFRLWFRCRSRFGFRFRHSTLTSNAEQYAWTHEGLRSVSETTCAALVFPWEVTSLAAVKSERIVVDGRYWTVMAIVCTLSAGP